jgi:hypothetical protein
MRNKEQLTVISREGGNVTYRCKCAGANNEIWKETTFTAPTLSEAKKLCSRFCRGKEASSTSSQKFSNFADWGGMSFQCADMPFASATGDKEEDMEDEIISEPPWWVGAAVGLLGGLKKYKKCTCTNPENGTTMTIDDCPIVRKCEKCCSSRWAGWSGEEVVQARR